MHINTHLNFNGQCDEAFQHYAKVLGGEVKFKMTWGESPMAKDLPADAQKLIMHASLKIGDGDIMGAFWQRREDNETGQNRYRRAG